MKKHTFFSVLLVFAVVTACRTENSTPANSEREAGEKIDSIESQAEQFEVAYHTLVVADTLSWLENLPDSLLHTILVLNRIDKAYLRGLDTLVVPDSLSVDLNLYSPFPDFVDSLKTVDKLICISRFAQVFALYENGKMQRWGPVSTGKESTKTPTGLFSTNWKRKVNISSVNSSWILKWSFNIENGSGVSLHEYALPGYPASHSCARMYAEDAEWIYYWADQWIMGEVHEVLAFGTPVVIFDDYPFHAQKPWLRLAENRDALHLSADRLYAEISPFLTTILDRQRTRNWVVKKQEEAKIRDEKSSIVE